MKRVLRKRTCVKTVRKTGNNIDTDTPTDQTEMLPRVDIFLNPKKKEEVIGISEEKKEIAKTYFEKSNMKKLYPKLFQILWESTLPCLPGLSV